MPREAPLYAIAQILSAKTVAAFAIGVVAAADLWSLEPVDVAVAAPPESYVVTPSKDGLYYLPATINGQLIHFLIDTGATSTLLSARDARRLGIGSGLRFNSTVETAGGLTSVAWTKFDKINMAERTISRVQVGVLRNGNVSVIGQDVLSRFNTVTFSAGEAHVS